MKCKIQEAAHCMRHHLEGIRLSPHFSEKDALVGFPNGCCEYGSLYLARYLIREQVVTKSEIKVPVKNIFNDQGQTHAWLRIKDQWHVDITADQFGKHLPKVIVSEESDFHDGFKPVIWESFDEADYYVFELLGSKLTFIEKTWDELQDFLPSISR